MATGIYQALTHPLEFRLLHLQPGEYKAPLVTDLIVCRLDDLSRPWTALSYTRGDPQWRGNITCNGAQVSITGNLHSALSGIRRSDKSILVWVDAICINQDDRLEKEAQVVLMRRIYSSASLVVADLGEAGPDYQDVADIWNALYSLVYSNTPGEYIDWDQYDSYGLPAFKDPKWKKWHRFLARPWFRRVWVQQEFALASSVAMMYGTDKIPGEMFPRIVSESMQRGLSSTVLDGDDDKTQRKDVDNSSYALASMLTARQDHHNGQTKGLFHHLRYLSAYCQATDDRDRIYALLGLATDAERSAINVNYSETVAEVYHRTAYCLISQGDGLKVVYEAGCYDYLDQTLLGPKLGR